MGADVDFDFLLVQKMRMGDEQAFNDFIIKYYPKILKYCRIHIDDSGYAEDMTQETFARFFRNLKEYKHYGKATNYLYAIAANTCSDYYRKKREIPFDELPEGKSITVINDTVIAKTEFPDTLLDVKIAIEKLPEELKEPAILFFIQERRQTDIAKILGISLPLLKYRIRRARKLLSDYFS